MTRKQFDKWAPPKSPLRLLATEIACLNASTWPTFLSRKGREPLNVLANGEISSKWNPLPEYCLKKAIRWKGNSPKLFGFSDGVKMSSKGLSLLFDPLVDAFLSTHLGASTGVPKDCTVLVLTDYYPFAGSECSHSDWAESVTQSILQGQVNGRSSTIVQLFDALFGKRRWFEQHQVISDGIQEKRLLLWNFFPFLRGGSIPTGSSGLPFSGDWRLHCWHLLSRFVEAVGAAQVVLACSQAMLPLAGPKVGAVNQLVVNVPGVNTPLPLLGGQKLFRISHPSSWKRVRNDGPLLNSLLTG
jgi:hypothetical protein